MRLPRIATPDRVLRARSVARCRSQTVTIHSAVSFLDELMILMNYSHRDWRLCAVCCLSVAGEERRASGLCRED